MSVWHRPGRAIIALAAALLLAVTSAQGATPDHVTEAVLAEDRPSDDRRQDRNRNPDAILAFLEAGPGDVVLDVRAGAGYYTELLSRVVGPEGRVIAQLSGAQVEAHGDSLRERAERLGNVEVVTGPLNEHEFEPESVDRVLLSQVLHDLISLDEDVFIENYNAMHAALRPMGKIVVIDHVAAADAGLEHTSDLHRIEPRAAAQTMVAAGGGEFGLAGVMAGLLLEATSDVLRNPDDDHSLPVFDDTVRGETDRFVHRFVKPHGAN